MSTESEARFNVYFAGQCLDGFAEEAVRDALGKLFKADAATLERLFSGSRQLIKRDCDRDTALTYQRAMKRVGARPVITPAGEAQTSATAGDPAGSVAGIGLAPPGSDVLRPEERLQQAPVDIDTDHLSAGPVGERLAPEQHVTPAVAAPDYEVAAPGTTIQAPPENAAPPEPDISALSVSDQALDLSDCAPPRAAPPPLDLAHLSVETGDAPLLTDAERQRDPVSAPDTSHLSLSDDPGASSHNSSLGSSHEKHAENAREHWGSGSGGGRD
jgi:hypothetical protein